MKKRNELALHLIGEVGHYILEANPKRLVISLHLEDDGFHLKILDDIVRSDQEIAEMNQMLHETQRPELAGYYGSMTGFETLGHARLGMVGWQVKHGEVRHRDGGSQIDIWLGGEQFDPAHFTIPADKS